MPRRSTQRVLSPLARLPPWAFRLLEQMLARARGRAAVLRAELEALQLVIPALRIALQVAEDVEARGPAR